MQIQDSAAAMKSYAMARGVDVFAPGRAAVVAAVWLSFYENVRADDTTTEDGAWPDALLFEWGRREALPGYYGACFYLNFTRQFVSAQGEDDDAMFQLTWQLEYEPTPDLRALGQRSEWCDGLASFSWFKDFVLSAEALKTAGERTANKVEFFLTGL